MELLQEHASMTQVCCAHLECLVHVGRFSGGLGLAAAPRLPGPPSPLAAPESAPAPAPMQTLALCPR